MGYLEEAEELFDYTQALRRDFHLHPELGFKEVRTAGIVARELRELGLEVTTGVADTGVMALLEGSSPGPVVMLRFDMDALPIQEQTGAEYASVHPGVMHACGHDGHTAIGLAAARLLVAHRQELAGTVKLVFQPAEEGLGGAERMIAEGVLEQPRPDYCLGVHVWNDQPVGWLGIAPGPVMAAGEIFQVRVKGQGGHGAIPHLAVDPVVASAHIITALQSIVSRNVSPLHTAVVSVTTMKAGDAFNVIPSEVTFSGTIRTFLPETRDLVLQRFHEVITGVANSLGCEAEVDVQKLTPAVINDTQITACVQRVAADLLPGDTISQDCATMGSEDMAYFMREIPGCFIFVGSRNEEEGLDAAHHHPRFDFDERALPRAAALVAASAAGFLNAYGDL